MTHIEVSDFPVARHCGSHDHASPRDWIKSLSPDAQHSEVRQFENFDVIENVSRQGRFASRIRARIKRFTKSLLVKHAPIGVVNNFVNGRYKIKTMREIAESHRFARPVS